MITSFKLFENKNKRWYKGFDIVKDTEKSPGEFGLWNVPELYYREFGNKILKGFKSISITQCKEAIDKWEEFNLNYNKRYR